MLTTTITILFLGHSISVAHSHGIFETSLDEEINFLSDVVVDEEEPSLGIIIRVTSNVVVNNPRNKLLLSRRRAEQTISQQCLDDMKGWGPDAGKYNEYKNVTDNLRESCPESSEMLNTDETDSLISLEYQMDMTNCDTSELRAFCDEYLTFSSCNPWSPLVTVELYRRM